LKTNGISGSFWAVKRRSLTMLETEGILTKKADPAHKQKFLYSLTTKGIDLLPVIIELGAWSMKYQPVDIEKFPHAGRVAKAGKPGAQKIRKDLAKKHLK
jgi:hypothetical protein